MTPQEVDLELGIPARTVWHWLRHRKVKRYRGPDGYLRVSRAEVIALRAKRPGRVRRSAPSLGSPELGAVLRPTYTRLQAPPE